MAVAWTLRNESVTSAVIGASRPAHVTEAVEALSKTAFSADELAAIDRMLAG
jgi:L-glyceraldehyde 3-phosphate reductase